MVQNVERARGYSAKRSSGHHRHEKGFIFHQNLSETYLIMQHVYTAINVPYAFLFFFLMASRRIESIKISVFVEHKGIASTQ